MTQTQCLDLLCERAALTRLAAVLAQSDQPSAPEWQYVRPLLEHRLHWLRVSLSQVDPVLIQSCEHLRAAGVLWPTEETERDRIVPFTAHAEPSVGDAVTTQMSDRRSTARVH